MRLALLLLPWVELFTLVELGAQTSALTAIAYVAATVTVGLLMLQRQGRGLLERLRRAGPGRMPGTELLLADMGVAFAALLLIFPGMITDVIALFVLIRPLRRRFVRALQPVGGTEALSRRKVGNRETIEGEYRRVDDKK